VSHAIPPAQRIITALDVEGREPALALVRQLGEARIFKVGLELFTAEGPGLLRDIRALGKDIFLDLKMHDIPNTVGEAVRMGVRHRARMMTVHASGGYEMMARAAEAARTEAERLGADKPLLLGVTVLTSLKDGDLAAIGIAAGTAAQVRRLAGLARKAEMDGIVCSAEEIEIVRAEAGPGLLIVTPGIRPAGADIQDQKRVMTPALAVARGSDYLVIGRPITRAASPAAAFAAIVAELTD